MTDEPINEVEQELTELVEKPVNEAPARRTADKDEAVTSLKEESAPADKAVEESASDAEPAAQVVHEPAAPVVQTSSAPDDAAIESGPSPPLSTPLPAPVLDSSGNPQEKPQGATAPASDNKDGHDIATASGSVREYLDGTVVPVLRKAMRELVKQRPADPYDFLANFILENKPGR